MTEYGFFDLGDGLLVDTNGEIIEAPGGAQTKAALLATKLYYATEQRESYAEIEGACKAALKRLQERGTVNYGEVAVTISANTRRVVDTVVLRSLLESLEAPRDVLLRIIEMATVPLDVAEIVTPLMEGVTDLPPFVGSLTETRFYEDKVRARIVRQPAPRKQIRETADATV